MVPDKSDVLYGSLGMLVLQTLAAIALPAASNRSAITSSP
jgi:hypothetical protein